MQSNAPTAVGALFGKQIARGQEEIANLLTAQ